MNANPSVTIIIAVRAINDYIRESLPYLHALDYRNYEILILPDQDEGDGERLPSVRVVASGAVGPAKKRDLGARLAAGDVLAFLDDDAYPRRDWLRNAVVHFQDPTIGAVGGPAVTPQNEEFWRRASGVVYSSWLGGGGIRYRYLPLVARDVDDFPSVNLLIRKDLFLALGGFDSHYWPGEDTKLCRDLVLKGYRIRYSPDVLVWHHRRTLYGDHLGQVANYSRHRGLFARRFPETSRRLQYFAPSLMLIALFVGISSALYSSGAKTLLFGLVGLYGGLLALSTAESAWRERSLGVALAAAIGVVLTHGVYGIWFMRGLVSKELVR